MDSSHELGQSLVSYHEGWCGWCRRTRTIRREDSGTVGKDHAYKEQCEQCGRTLCTGRTLQPPLDVDRAKLDG